MRILKPLNTLAPFPSVILCIVFLTSFLIYPDLDPKTFEAIPNPEADVPKVVHDLKKSQPSSGHYVLQIADGIRVYDNLQPKIIHNVADWPDLSTPHGILWLVSGIGAIGFGFKSSFDIYKKLKSKYMDTVLNYLRSNSFS